MIISAKQISKDRQQLRDKKLLKENHYSDDMGSESMSSEEPEIDNPANSGKVKDLVAQLQSTAVVMPEENYIELALDWLEGQLDNYNGLDELIEYVADYYSIPTEDAEALVGVLVESHLRESAPFSDSDNFEEPVLEDNTDVIQEIMTQIGNLNESDMLLLPEICKEFGIMYNDDDLEFEHDLDRLNRGELVVLLKKIDNIDNEQNVDQSLYEKKNRLKKKKSSKKMGSSYC
jgi:hypothetical protein